MLRTGFATNKESEALLMQEDTYCKYCHKLITFVRTVNGEKMPCDSARVDFCEDPSGEHKVILESGRIAYGYVLTSETDDSVKAYRPHWASCPNADQVPRSSARKAAQYKKSVKRVATTDVHPSDGKSRRDEAAPTAVTSTGHKTETGAEAGMYEQMSCFPELKPRLKDQLCAFNA